MILVLTALLVVLNLGKLMQMKLWGIKEEIAIWCWLFSLSFSLYPQKKQCCLNLIIVLLDFCSYMNFLFELVQWVHAYILLDFYGTRLTLMRLIIFWLFYLLLVFCLLHVSYVVCGYLRMRLNVVSRLVIEQG